MGVEFLRTPFRQRVRPYRDRPDLECFIDWYPCAEDAKVLPFATNFNTNLFADWWSRDADIGPVGFIGSNNWAEKKPGRGQGPPCLTPEQAVEGFEYNPDLVCERGPDGLPLCCGLGLVATGGMVMGGRADFEFPLVCTAVTGWATPLLIPNVSLDACIDAVFEFFDPQWFTYDGLGGAGTPDCRLEAIAVPAGTTFEVWSLSPVFPGNQLLATLATGQFWDWVQVAFAQLAVRWSGYSPGDTTRWTTTTP